MRKWLTAFTILAAQPAAAQTLPPLTTWYWQLTGNINTKPVAKVYDIDMEDNSVAVMNQVKAAGHFLTCYISVGDWENYRSDAASFPASVIGKDVGGWPGEKYIDIRSPIVQAIMLKRFQTAASKGCQAIEPDLDDTYTDNTGFPITKAIQITYDTWVATQVHALGMKIALKNATDLAAGFASLFDFAIVEQCFQYKECPKYSAFVTAGKAVLEAEYKPYNASVCTQATTLKFSTAFYGVALNGRKYVPCG